MTGIVIRIDVNFLFRLWSSWRLWWTALLSSPTNHPRNPLLHLNQTIIWNWNFLHWLDIDNCTLRSFTPSLNFLVLTCHWKNLKSNDINCDSFMSKWIILLLKCFHNPWGRLLHDKQHCWFAQSTFQGRSSSDFVADRFLTFFFSVSLFNVGGNNWECFVP